MFTKTKSVLIATWLIFAFSIHAHATLSNYNVNNADLVYSSVSNVTWTKDANLLGSMFASQGFNIVVNAIIAVSPIINDLPNYYDGNTGTYSLTVNDFSSNGLTTWFGAMAYVNYLNSIQYGGSDQWRLPIIGSLTSSNTQSNGQTPGNELPELFYQELNGSSFNKIPNTATFDNEQAYAYWSGTEHPSLTYLTWIFRTFNGIHDTASKSAQLYAWAVSPGNISALNPVPEPESIVMFLVGLGLMTGVFCCKQKTSS